mgnify:CR=1 FL=1|tara:strand:+ start:9789 stop:10622 length:834 start_codon:yes stop_codon:yes gene_type:complete
MGLQDELQAEVDRIRAREASDYAMVQAQEAFYQQHLGPAMRAAETYFVALVDKLKVIGTDISVRYPLDPQQPEGVELRQSDYRLRTDGKQDPRQIDVLCSCKLDKPREFYVPTESRVENRAKLLHAYNFLHHRKNKLDNFYNICGATFILEGPMTARIRIMANPADRCIDVELRNFFQDPEPRRHRFEGEAFDEEMLERLAKLLLRQIPQLIETTVSPALRDELRQQLEAEEALREQDLAAAHAERARAEQEEAEQARLLNRLRRGFGKLSRKTSRD